MRRWWGMVVVLATCGDPEPATPEAAVVEGLPARPAPVEVASGVAVDASPAVVASPTVGGPAVTAKDGPGFATVITKDGIGPFGARLANSAAAIGRLVPGLKVTATKDMSESHDIDRVTVSRAGATVLTMVMDNYRATDKLFTLTATDPMFVTATGIGVGSTVEDLAAKHTDAGCTFAKYDPGLDVLGVERRLYCETRDLPNIRFELDAGAWKGDPGKIAVDRLAARKLVAVIWGAAK